MAWIGRRRTRHEDGGRSRQVHVRLTDSEYETVAAHAAATGMSVASYLAVRGQDRIAGTDDATSVGPKLRALVAELYALKRILRGSGNNLNQLTKLAHGTGEVKPEVWHHAARIAAMEQRLEAFLGQVDAVFRP